MDVSAKIIRQYIKDLSFENPGSPIAFRVTDESPTINALVDVKATNQKDTDVYEIELNINITATKNNENIYIIDLKYMGIFEIKNLTDDVKEAYLLVECPRQLFPFARRIVFDLHADGALPSLMMDPVNFAELYKKRKQKAN